MKRYHTVKDVNGGWKTTEETTGSVIAVGQTKEETVKAAAVILQEIQGSNIIHKADGRIQEERTYPRSKDPRSSKG